MSNTQIWLVCLTALAVFVYICLVARQWNYEKAGRDVVIFLVAHRRSSYTGDDELIWVNSGCQLSLPGGPVRDNESSKQAAYRILNDDLNVVLGRDCLGFIGSYPYKTTGGFDRLAECYLLILRETSETQRFHSTMETKPISDLSAPSVIARVGHHYIPISAAASTLEYWFDDHDFRKDNPYVLTNRKRAKAFVSVTEKGEHET